MSRKTAVASLATLLACVPASYAERARSSEKERLAYEQQLAAATKGDARAAYLVGAMLELGQGVDQDQVEAVRWQLRAARQRHVPAMIRLVDAYYKGRGVAKDRVEAFKWAVLAMENGDDEKQSGRGLAAGLSKTLSEAERQEAKRRVLAEIKGLPGPTVARVALGDEFQVAFPAAPSGVLTRARGAGNSERYEFRGAGFTLAAVTAAVSGETPAEHWRRSMPSMGAVSTGCRAGWPGVTVCTARARTRQGGGGADSVIKGLYGRKSMAMLTGSFPMGRPAPPAVGDFIESAKSFP